MARTERDECCGNCKHQHVDAGGYYICMNPDAEGYALETMYSDCCDEFESRYEDGYEE